MNKFTYLIIFTLFFNYGFSQIGINTTSPRGALHLNSTTGGFVPPLLTIEQRENLTVHMRPKGTIIFNSDENILQINTGTDEIPKWSTFYFPTATTGTETKKTLYNAVIPDANKEVIIGRFKFRIIPSPTNTRLSIPQFCLTENPENTVSVSYHVGQYYDNADPTKGGYQYMNTTSQFTSSNYNVFVNPVPAASGSTMSNLERNELWLAYPGDDSIYHVQYLIIGTSASGSSNTYGILVNKY